jgi:hypothetical protein
MMTQTAPEGEPHFVITMAEHTEMCGQLARAFGNDCFDRLDPFEEAVYVVENHDRGWDGYDANPGIDPVTRLPYIMARTPISDIVKTNVGSPDFNEAHHPYCGLLSSMHSVGLYNGRYGFSQFVVRTQTTTSLSVPHSTSARRVRRVMRENGLLAPHRVGRTQLGSRRHSCIAVGQSLRGLGAGAPDVPPAG